MIKERETIHRDALINMVSNRTGVPKKYVKMTLNATFDVIINALIENKKVMLTNFGTFETRVRKGRISANPLNENLNYIPATRSPFFKPATSFRKQVKGYDRYLGIDYDKYYANQKKKKKEKRKE